MQNAPSFPNPLKAVHGPGVFRDPGSEVEANCVERERRRTRTYQPKLVLADVGSSRQYTGIFKDLDPRKRGLLAQLHEVSRRRSGRIVNSPAEVLTLFVRKCLRFLRSQFAH